VAGLSEFVEAAQQTSVEPICGIEFSAQWNHQLIHIVGLNVDPTHSALLSGVAENTRRRVDRAELMHQDLEKHGINIREQVAKQLGDSAVPTRPHFANGLIEIGKAKDKRQAFKRYLVRGKPGFINLQWPEFSQVAKWIYDAGGVPVLAHPMRYKFSRSKLIRLIEDMKPAGINAIEVSTPTVNEQQATMLTQLAVEFELSASMGSDFHAHGQPWAILGRVKPLPDSLTPVWSHFAH